MIRNRVVEWVRLLGSASSQLKYERDVPHVFVPAELISGFADDLYHPKSTAFIAAFREDELKDLAELYGLVAAASRELEAAKVHTVGDLLTLPVWRSVLTFAKDLAARLEQP